MKFAHRLGYYLGGFAIGLIILAFFLNGKKASCDYGPNARTVKNISSKPMVYSSDVASFVAENNLDSLTVKQLIQYGDVDFTNSDTKAMPCKLYAIENSYKDKDVILKVENCDSLAKIIDFKFY